MVVKQNEEHAYYFEELGEKFDTYMSDYDVERRLDLIFGRLLAGIEIRGTRVLEVGCGTGRFSEEIVRRGGRLTVLDIGQTLVRQVAARLGCKGVVADACSLPFKAGAFEVVISSECIEHTADPRQAIREMCRVCSGGGTVCLTTPNRRWYPMLVLAQKLKLRKFAGTEHWVYSKDAAEVMREEGMGGIRLDGCHLWPFQLKITRWLLRRLDRSGRWLYPLMINFGVVGEKRIGGFVKARERR